MDQLNIFEVTRERFKIDKPIRLIELFAGYGSQALSFKYLDVPIEHYKVVEFDEAAIKAYNNLHGTNFSTIDITTVKGSDLEIVDIDKYCYIMTYSFPCTDLSKAGKQKGLDNTRSGLVYEVLRILQELSKAGNLPQVLLMENVIDLIQVKFIKEFNEIQNQLQIQYEYCNYVEVLNAKDYNDPQTRARVFMDSIYGESYYEFPQQQELKVKLKDMLEINVEERYYLKAKHIKQIYRWNSQQNPIENSKSVEDEYIQCITAKSNTSMNASMLLIRENVAIENRSGG